MIYRYSIGKILQINSQEWKSKVQKIQRAISKVTGVGEEMGF